MFGFLKDIADNIYAEINLALPPSNEKVYDIYKEAADNKDGLLCSYIDDDIDWIDAGMILNELEKGSSLDEIENDYSFRKEGTVRKVLSAKKDLEYFRAKGYDDDMIENIGKISRLLCVNGDDIIKVSEYEKYDIELVKKVKMIRDEYINSKRSQQTIKPFIINSEPMVAQ